MHDEPWKRRENDANLPLTASNSTLLFRLFIRQSASAAAEVPTDPIDHMCKQNVDRGYSQILHGHRRRLRPLTQRRCTFIFNLCHSTKDSHIQTRWQCPPMKAGRQLRRTVTDTQCRRSLDVGFHLASCTQYMPGLGPCRRKP